MSDSRLFFAHESAYLDEGCSIGAGTKIWHFTHIMSGAIVGERCTYTAASVVLCADALAGTTPASSLFVDAAEVLPTLMQLPEDL